MPTILAVDDDPSILRLLDDTLTLAGYTVRTASNGEQALEEIDRRSFDLVVLDIMMPGLDGYEVLERMKQMPSRRDTPVIVVTAKHDPAGVLRELDGGAADHIAKPFHTDELEIAVARVLAGTGTELRRSQVATEAEVYNSMALLFQEAQESAGR